MIMILKQNKKVIPAQERKLVPVPKLYMKLGKEDVLYEFIGRTEDVGC